MLRRNGHGRAGFTLIEMLVVISIIIVIMSLLLPAVMKVSDAGDRAENRARLLAINTALNTVKGNSAFGNATYIPAGRPIFDANGRITGSAPFRLRAEYPVSAVGTEPNVSSFEAQYLIARFNIPIDDNRGIGGPYNGKPAVGLCGDGSKINADLDANQTLTFFLGGIPEADGSGKATFPGFSTNPAAPFTKRGQIDDPRKTTGIDLGGGGKPKYALSSPGVGSPTGGSVPFARLLDAYGTPYAYFCAFNGQTNKYFGFYHAADYATLIPSTPAGATILAYRTGGNATDPYENPNGYQLISAGKNRVFGVTGNTKDIKREGEDDLTNILEKQLGSQ